MKYRSILPLSYNQQVKYSTHPYQDQSKTLQSLYDNLTPKPDPLNNHPNISVIPSSILTQFKTCENLLKCYENEENIEKENLNSEITNLMKENMKLSSKILELNGNNKVYVRIKPVESDNLNIIECNNTSLSLINPTSQEKYNFTFDKCYNINSNFTEIYEDFKPIINSILNNNNNNMSIFAYGESESGKSYNLFGNDSENGLCYLLITDLFNMLKLKEEKEKKKFELKLSLIEIYNNDKINYLLNDSTDSERIININTIEDIERIIKDIYSIRCNKNSKNKSDCILTIYIDEYNEKDNKEIEIINQSKLFIIDLVGSEIVKDSNCLCNLLQSLDNKNDFLRIRNSKLKSILKEIFEYNSKIIYLLTIIPKTENLNNTLSSLRFGKRIKEIDSSEYITVETLTEIKNEYEKRENYLKEENEKLIKENEMLNDFIHSNKLNINNEEEESFNNSSDNIDILKSSYIPRFKSCNDAFSSSFSSSSSYLNNTNNDSYNNTSSFSKSFNSSRKYSSIDDIELDNNKESNKKKCKNKNKIKKIHNIPDYLSYNNNDNSNAYKSDDEITKIKHKNIYSKSKSNNKMNENSIKSVNKKPINNNLINKLKVENNEENVVKSRKYTIQSHPLQKRPDKTNKIVKNKNKIKRCNYNENEEKDLFIKIQEIIGIDLESEDPVYEGVIICGEGLSIKELQKKGKDNKNDVVDDDDDYEYEYYDSTDI